MLEKWQSVNQMWCMDGSSAPCFELFLAVVAVPNSERRTPCLEVPMWQESIPACLGLLSVLPSREEVQPLSDCVADNCKPCEHERQHASAMFKNILWTTLLLCCADNLQVCTTCNNARFNICHLGLLPSSRKVHKLCYSLYKSGCRQLWVTFQHKCSSLCRHSKKTLLPEVDNSNLPITCEATSLKYCGREQFN